MSDLAAQHRHLIPQHEDFRFLGGIAAGQQNQPAHNPEEDQIRQSEAPEDQG
jgi:hypothetical protein